MIRFVRVCWRPLVDRGGEGDEGKLRFVRVCWRTTC